MEGTRFHELDSPPPSTTQRYTEWLHDNRTVVKLLQDLLKSAVFVIPDRYGDMALLAEGVQATAQVASTFNTFLLLRHDNPPPVQQQQQPKQQQEQEQEPFGNLLHTQQGEQTLTELSLTHSQLLLEILLAKSSHFFLSKQQQLQQLQQSKLQPQQQQSKLQQQQLKWRSNSTKHLEGSVQRKVRGVRFVLVIALELIKCWIRLCQLAHRTQSLQNRKKLTQPSSTATTTTTTTPTLSPPPLSPPPPPVLVGSRARWLMWTKGVRKTNHPSQQNIDLATATYTKRQQEMFLRTITEGRGTSINFTDIYGATNVQANGATATENELNNNTNQDENNSQQQQPRAPGFLADVRAVVQLFGHVTRDRSGVLVGELVHVLGPLAYAIATLREAHPSWRTWLISFIFEFFSVLSFSRAKKAFARKMQKMRQNQQGELGELEAVGNRRPAELSAEEQMLNFESSVRSRALASFFFRSPFLEIFTRPILQRFVGKLTWIPLLGGILEQLAKILDALPNYHYYTNLL